MKQLSYLSLLATSISLLTGCRVVGGIFKGGVYVGVFAVLIVLALIIWLIAKFRRKS